MHQIHTAVTQLGIQLPAKAHPGKAQNNGWGAWVMDTQQDDPDGGDSGSRLHTSPALVSAGMWGVSQGMEDLSLCLSDKCHQL